MTDRNDCTGCLGFTGPPCGCTCHGEDYRYQLTATLGDDERTYYFNEPDPDFGPDVEEWRQVGATATAVREIMNRAYADPEGPWALGKIVLTDTLTGEVMREMPAKDRA